ncbi:sensor histidine kinase [Tessaracoccus sp. Y36]
MTRRVIAATLFVCCGPVSLLAAWNGFDWYLDGPTLLIAILAGYTAGAWLPRLEAAGSVVLSTSLLVLANQALGDGFHWLDDLVFFAVLVGGPALAGAAVKARALHVGRLARLQAELEEQQRIDVEAARLDVLNGVQAEVHADLAERIAGIALRAEGALRGGDRTALPVLERQARQVLDLLRDAVGSMREETPTAADVPEPEPTAPRTDWSPSDALMAAALAVAMGVEVALTSDARGPLLWVDVVGAAAVCTPLVWRRTHPILAAAVSSALGVLMSAWLTPISSLVTGIALLSALFYSIGAWCPARRLLLGGAITAAGVVAIELVGPGEGVGPVLLWSLSALLLGRIVSGWQERLRRTREVVEALERGRGAAVRLAVAREREALASTLHDTVAHGMTVVCLHAGARQRQGSGQDATLSLIAQVAAQSLDELKNGLETIESRAAPLDPARLAAIGRRAGVDVTVSADPVPAGAAAVLAHRIVREAIINVARHAAGATAQVRVRRLPGAIMLEVLDGGAEHTGNALPGTGTGTGLKGLAAAIAAAGGTLDTGPTAGGGFRVAATIPQENP